MCLVLGFSLFQKSRNMREALYGKDEVNEGC